MSTLDPKHIGLAVITSYPMWYEGDLQSINHTDKIRGDLALAFFMTAAKSGYQAVCVDANSPQGFKKSISNIPHMHVINAKNSKASEAKRQAIKSVSKLDGVQVIVLSEPEKISFLASIPQVVSPILKNICDIVVPKRKLTLFKKTYPDYMYVSEMEGNRLFNKTLQQYGLLTKDVTDMDSFFGPRAFRNDSSLIALFTKRYIPEDEIASLYFFLSPEAYANSLYLPIANALALKMRVKSIAVPFQYPPLQKENEQVGVHTEFVEKRVMQRIGILMYLMQFLRTVKK